MKQMKISPEIRAALEAVLDYLYDDEERNFEEAEEPADHIFPKLETLNRWLEGQGDCSESDVLSQSAENAEGEKRMGKIAFPLGKITATPLALKRIHFADICAALDRHEAGEWNRIPPETRAQNERALKTGGALLSGHFDYRGRYFWVQTNPERTETIIESAEGENPGPEI